MGTLSAECKLWETLYNQQPGFFDLKKMSGKKKKNKGMGTIRKWHSWELEIIWLNVWYQVISVAP